MLLFQSVYIEITGGPNDIVLFERSLKSKFPGSWSKNTMIRGDNNEIIVVYELDKNQLETSIQSQKKFFNKLQSLFSSHASLLPRFADREVKNWI